MTRVLISSMLGVILSEIGFATTSIMYRMPYAKARFDAADKSGSRVVMELAMSFVWNASAVVASIILLICLVYIPDVKQALSSFFVLAGVIFSLFATSQFPMFRKPQTG